MPENFDFDLSGFEETLKAELERSNAAFKGKYASELDQLMGLSRTEIDALTPDITDLQKYDQLIAVVKDASSRNLAQAELKNRVERLGKIAVTIAKKVPSLASIFV